MSGRPRRGRQDGGIAVKGETMQAAPSISIVELFLNADIVVKGVLLLLLAGSIWSWAVIAEKWWRVGTVSRSMRAHEARAAAARSAGELWAESAPADDPAAQVLTAGLRESRAAIPADSESLGERRARVER